MPRLYLLLGTNLGDRRANLQEALRRLDAVFGVREVQAQVVETKAIGFNGGDFLNTAVCYRTRRRPERILALCKEIEHAMGRTDPPEYAPDGSRIYHDRIIDIDILSYGRLECNTPQLTIPHPQLRSRPFAAALYAQIGGK